METIFIEGTKSTPEVHLDPEKNIIQLRGQSYPENAFKFFEPIFDWLDQYLEELQEEAVVIVDFFLPYINTASSKCIMMFLEKCDEAFLSGKKVTLNWYYHPENESELECAEEFVEDISLPFQIIPREEE